VAVLNVPARRGDAWVRTIERVHILGLARGFGFGFTLPAGLTSRRIDYVFARNLEVTQAKLLTATASDHVPLWSVLSPVP